MSFIKNYFHKILLLSCIILSLLNLINCWIFKIEYVFLSENQILYIYSSLAQVIGALLGLTIAGYSMVDSKLKTLSEADTTITEYVEDTRHDYYREYPKTLDFRAPFLFRGTPHYPQRAKSSILTVLTSTQQIHTANPHSNPLRHCSAIPQHIPQW